MSPFQLVVTGVFATLLLVGVAVFALFGGLGGAGGVGSVQIWGTLPAGEVNDLLVTLRQENDAYQEVTYFEQDPETYASVLISAMAAGQGPDLFLLRHEDLGLFSDKVIPLPYSYISEREFAASFIEEGSVFLSPEGALALPVLIDPLVMYWNRDLFAAAGIATPPRYWDDFLALAPQLTSQNSGTAVSRSAVAMGEWRNIRNAKAIVSALMMQAGDPIVTRSTDGRLVATLGSAAQGAVEAPAPSALRFYTEFANPSKATYSWNRSLPEAQDAFVSNMLGVYFGFASEYQQLLARNPNIRFSVETLPQIEGRNVLVTYGNLTGVAISRAADNVQGAATVAAALAGQSGAARLAQLQGLPSVRRDAQANTGADAAASVFAQSALIARGWFDPSPTESNAIFQEMIESVASGRNTPAGAVSDAGRLLDQLLP